MEMDFFGWLNPILLGCGYIVILLVITIEKQKINKLAPEKKYNMYFYRMGNFSNVLSEKILIYSSRLI